MFLDLIEFFYRFIPKVFDTLERTGGLTNGSRLASVPSHDVPSINDKS